MIPLLCWVAKKSFRDVTKCDALLWANTSVMPLRERRKTPHVPLVFMTETPVIVEADALFPVFLWVMATREVTVQSSVLFYQPVIGLNIAFCWSQVTRVTIIKLSEPVAVYFGCTRSFSSSEQH